jgi:hypothetical protein
VARRDTLKTEFADLSETITRPPVDATSVAVEAATSIAVEAASSVAVEAAVEAAVEEVEARLLQLEAAVVVAPTLRRLIIIIIIINKEFEYL